MTAHSVWLIVGVGWACSLVGFALAAVMASVSGR